MAPRMKHRLVADSTIAIESYTMDADQNAQVLRTTDKRPCAASPGRLLGTVNQRAEIRTATLILLLEPSATRTTAHCSSAHRRRPER